MADDDVTLLPLSHCPMLKRASIERRCLNEEAPFTAAWGKKGEPRMGVWC